MENDGRFLQCGSIDLKKVSIQKRTLALGDQFVHNHTLALTNAMDFYTLANLVRNLDDLETKLNVLSMYRIDLDSNVTHEIRNILHGFQDVVIDDCDGTDLDQLIAAILMHTNIHRLRFFSQVIDPRIDSTFETGLRSSSISELSLTIELTPNAAENLASGINQSTSLKSLSLDQSEIYVGVVEILCTCFQNNHTLESLKLDHCHLRDLEVADLVRSVKHHSCLKELSLRMNRMQEEGMNAVVELLQSTQTLERLDLAQQNPGNLDLVHLSSGMRANYTLSCLNLQENILDNAHIREFIDVLSENSTLRELNLEDCELRDCSLDAFIGFLKKESCRLTSIWLKANKFHTAPSVEDLIEIGRNNHFLQFLDIGDDNWIPKCLKFGLLLNRAGRRFFNHKVSQIHLWPHLLEKARSVIEKNDDCFSITESDVIFNLISGNVLLQI